MITEKRKTTSLKETNVKKKQQKKLNFLEKIYHFLRDTFGILDSSRYCSSSEHVNYHFLVSFQIAIQIYDTFGN